MELRIVEAGQGHTAGLSNHGKCGIGRYTGEQWAEPGQFPGSESSQLLRQCGWGPRHYWVLDLQTGEGAVFQVPGYAPADLNKRRIWVCPMFEPFLAWMFEHARREGANWFERLPRTVMLDDAEFCMHGYRRAGVHVDGLGWPDTTHVT